MANSNTTVSNVLHHPAFDRAPVKNPHTRGRKKGVITLQQPIRQKKPPEPADNSEHPIITIQNLMDQGFDASNRELLTQWITETKVLLMRIQTIMEISRVCAGLPNKPIV